ncbi:DUF3842 family protein [Mogibacterium pumilum]|uniref:DUF3842 domain-containing protein n=1 Tax=Mogibacterium pumilum TaxID=86332 RepID=A0A223AQR5_9FIRM|nr:DUF3842 family protein [Mogibacterium pumilum]ASS37313.1 hypothetical protein AXF17_01725 [Mogibacterium pumilum]
MNILVIDAQGGGIGRQLVIKLLEKFPEADIVAAGTNSMATNAMIKAGAKKAATGENAIRYCAAQAEIIAGPIGIIVANAMLGEISPVISESVGSSSATKVLIPVTHCNTIIAGPKDLPIKDSIEDAVDRIVRICGVEEN